MRSIGRVEAPRWLSNKSPKAAGSSTSEAIEIFCGESDSRYSQRPGTWQMGVHHDLSPLAWTRREDRRLTRPSVPAKGRRRPWDRLESF